MATKKQIKLSAKWQLDAALLSRPVDLTALVTMSKSEPDNFIVDNTLHRLISMLLNEKNKSKSDKDTKLDVLNILANVAASKNAIPEVRVALQGISEWFDEYMAAEEAEPGEEPELHKAMVLLLARCWDYKLKTEDVLELTQGNRRIALCTVVGLLEDGETYSTTLKQRQRPGQGKIGQWEHELVCQRYEKPLLLQICRLLRGFTHPGTYFEASSDEIALFSVERFASEMDCLLDITMRSRLVEKLSMALYDCLFHNEEDDEDEEENGDGDGDEGKEDDSRSMNLLEESDHMAVVSVHAFLQNLYFYATQNVDEYRRHMLVDTLLIPRLVLPYLDRCVLHVLILNNRAQAYSDLLEGDHVAQMVTHNPNLIKGIAASLRTIIVAAFRAPTTQFVMTILRKFNPTGQMLRARVFCLHNEYIFSLLCMLNVNMGALDLSRGVSANGSGGGGGGGGDGDDYTSFDGYHAHSLLYDLASLYAEMDKDTQARVYKRVVCSGALPICRDTPSYAAVVSVLLGGAAGQLEYSGLSNNSNNNSNNQFANTCSSLPHTINDASGGGGGVDEEEMWDSRAEAKRAHADRMTALRLAEEIAGVSSTHDTTSSSTTTTGNTHPGSSSDRLSQQHNKQQPQQQHQQRESKHDSDDDVPEPFDISELIRSNQTSNNNLAAEAKTTPSAFEIAVSIANAADQRQRESKTGEAGAKSSSSTSTSASYRLLGELPTLGGARCDRSGGGGGGGGSGDSKEDRRDAVRVSLQLPGEAATKRFLMDNNNNNNNASITAAAADPGIPQEFLCAINGHVMKDPVRALSSGLCFERATIELWLSTRGSVCPITHAPLYKEDLTSDDDLRNRIKRYHIQQTTRRTAALPEDDLYDF